MLQHWASEGEFYIGGFVLLTFIEPVRLALNECQQYKTAYVELTFTHPTFSSFQLFPNVPFDLQSIIVYTRGVYTYVDLVNHAPVIQVHIMLYCSVLYIM